MTELAPGRAQGAVRGAAVMGGLVAVIGAAGLLGWLLDVRALRSVSADWVSMKANTAVSLVLVGCALVLVSRGRHRLAVVLALSAGAVGVLTLVEIASGRGMGIDELLFSDPEAGPNAPGRMAPETAVLLAATALAVLGAVFRGRRRAPAAQALALLVASVGLLVACGYAFGVAALIRPASQSEMALSTAVAFVLVGVALVLLTPSSTRFSALVLKNGAAGLMARRLLPFAVLAPVALGLLVTRPVGPSLDVTERVAGAALLGMYVMGAVIVLTAFSLDAVESEILRSADRLANERELLQAVLHQMPGGLVMVDAETGRLLQRSRETEEMFGAPRLDAAGNVDFSAYPCFRPDGSRYEPDELPLLRALHEGEVVTGEELIAERAPGDRITVEVNAAPVRDADGRIVIGLTTFKDVTRRKRAEEEEARSREALANARFEGLLESAPDAIVIVDEQSTIVAANSQAESLFGHDKAAIVGSALDVLVPMRQRHSHHEHIRRFHARPATRAMGNGLELYGLRRDGSEFPIDVHLGPLAVDGQARVVAAVRDVSDARRREELFREAAAQLAEANADLDAFTYSVSHDLRAPLRAVGGFAHILAEEHASSLSADGMASVERIVQGVDRMSALIDGLLRLSRVAQRPLDRRHVAVDALVAAAVDNVTGNGAGVEITTGELPPCEADAELLEQVFANLLSNAVKFSAGAHAPKVEIGSLPRPSGTVYFVRDNGLGFDMRDAGRLFGPFQRLHPSGEDRSGLGIGLAIVKRIVHQHGGSVWADAAPGEGATFFFTLDGGTS